MSRAMRTLVIGSSGGIGAALVGVTGGDGLSRSRDGLDVTDAGSVARVLGETQVPYDRIWIAIGTLAAGAAPEKSLSAIDPETMTRVMAVNTIGVALLLREVPRLLAPMGRVGVLSARVGSIGDNGLGGWHSYRASKAATNQLVRGAAIELKRTHKATVLALHPGTVDTHFTAGYAAPKVPPLDAARNLVSVLDSATETGQFLDYAGKVIPW